MDEAGLTVAGSSEEDDQSATRSASELDVSYYSYSYGENHVSILSLGALDEMESNIESGEKEDSGTIVGAVVGSLLVALIAAAGFFVMQTPKKAAVKAMASSTTS